MARTDGPRRHAGLEVGPAGRGVLEASTARAERLPLRPVVARMLDRDEQRFVVGREHGPHSSAPAGQRKNSFEVRARFAFGLERPHPVGAAGRRGPNCRRSRSRAGPRLSIAQLSGMPNQPSLVVADEKVAPTAATDGSPHCTRISHLNFAAAWSPSGGVISMMWPNRCRRAGWRRRPGRPCGCVVVGEDHVDLVGLRVGLDVLRPVHLGGAERDRRRAAPRSARRPGCGSRWPRSAGPGRAPAASSRAVPSAL